MQFKNFLADRDGKCFQEHASVSFYGGGTYPLLFFSLLMQKLKTASAKTVVTHAVDAQELSHLYALLETDFLGGKLVWVSGVHALDAKRAREVVRYLSAYKGPHTVLWYEEAAVPQETAGITVELPGTLDRALSKDLIAYFMGPQRAVRSEPALAALSQLLPSCSLDTACLLMRYWVLLGNSYPAFLQEWLPECVEVSPSLFKISQAFFARNAQQFFTQWRAIADLYSQQFWITYWSEQLWRSKYVIEALKKNNIAEAKGLAYRLPFSFMQGDWKRHSPTALARAHHELYLLDYAFKNGAQFLSLDLFFSKYLVHSKV